MLMLNMVLHFKFICNFKTYDYDVPNNLLTLFHCSMEEGISFSNFEICIGDEASGTRFIDPLGELPKLQETTSITCKLLQTNKGPIKSLDDI
jgi:hypothetical protein